MSKFKETFIGSRTFYRNLIILALPIVIQHGISNFVNLLDNVMVGQMGTESLSAVAIINQLFQIYNFAIFGGLSGASIFGVQFFGKGDREGVRATFRFKFLFSLLASGICIAVMLWQGDGLISLFLSESESQGDLALTLREAKTYMTIMLVGLVPFAVAQTYANTLREAKETMKPMISSIIAILTNFVLNYLLIFGHFGFPKMGIAGAAWATVIARFVEALYLIIVTHANPQKYPFIEKIYRSMRIPGSVLKKIAVTGMPLMVNEIVWSIGITMVNQNFSTRGLSVVAATNITTTAGHIFKIILIAMGNAAAILLGQQLGSNQIEEAKKTNYKLMFLSFVMQCGIAVAVISAAPFIPLLYNTEEEVRSLATVLLIIAAAVLPIQGITHQCYYAMRSGGQTIGVFLFDCLYTWGIQLPLAFVLCQWTDWPMMWVYFGVQFAEIIKMSVGVIIVKSGVWAKNIINSADSKT